MFVAFDVIWRWWWQRWRWLGCVCHCVSSRAKMAMIMRALEDTLWGGRSWALEDCCHRIFLSFISTKVTTLINLGRRNAPTRTRGICSLHLTSSYTVPSWTVVTRQMEDRHAIHFVPRRQACALMVGTEQAWELKKCKHVSQFPVLLCLEIWPLPRNILLKRPLAICQQDVTCVFLGCWSSKVIGLGGQDCRWFQCGQRPFVKSVAPPRFKFKHLVLHHSNEFLSLCAKALLWSDCRWHSTDLPSLESKESHPKSCEFISQPGEYQNYPPISNCQIESRSKSDWPSRFVSRRKEPPVAVGLGGFPTSTDGWFSSKPGSSWYGGGPWLL